MNDKQLDKLVAETEELVKADYATHEATARNHAKIQSSLVRSTVELIKTIRTLDNKNSRLQHQVAQLTKIATVTTVVATAASLIALFK